MVLFSVEYFHTLSTSASRACMGMMPLDTANIQIRTLTQGLGMYSVKRLLMNTQD